MRRGIFGCAKRSREWVQPRDTFWLAHYIDIRRRRRVGRLYCSFHDLSSSKIDVNMESGAVWFFDLNIHLMDVDIELPSDQSRRGNVINRLSRWSLREYSNEI